MSSFLEIAPQTDDRERREALAPGRSFIVQSPAGSGKTELLIQRYLLLLGGVEKPEQIQAVTFTKKAAAEMRERILHALERAAHGPQPEQAHEMVTHELALAALKRDRARGWDLMENPGRMRVQTIDALCQAIVIQMPWLARQGALPDLVEEAGALYLRAAHRTLAMVEQEGPHREWIEHVLMHLDNNMGRVSGMLKEMLGKREQWIELAVQVNDKSRAILEENLAEAARLRFDEIERLIPVEDLAYVLGCCGGDWRCTAETLLTKDGTWRKRGMAEVISRLSRIDGVQEALHLARTLPPERYTDEQWRSMRALLETLKLAVGQLRLVFREEVTADFCEMSLAAEWALGHADDPSELALQLDARNEHLLIDEFQDTSAAQVKLVGRLTDGWEPGDGRTMFLVGDPMQSIYRFRQADVGLFLKAKHAGIGQLRPEPLTLSANYRSVSGIVEWVNRVFGRVFPEDDQAETGAVRYSASYANRGGGAAAVELHAFGYRKHAEEAQAAVNLVRRARAEDPAGKVAILVKARTHLPAVLSALKRAGLSFRGVKIEDLGDRLTARDLLSLTRAMLHLGDRVAWLAVLRAPWCGLTLRDLHALAGRSHRALLWDALRGDLNGLSEEGRLRAARLRVIFERAFAERGRRTLRMWIEQTWRELGGPACADAKDAADYFDLLEKEQLGPDLPDFDAFALLVGELRAQPDLYAGEELEVMTIHQAKGLEFDTVIVPGMGRGTRTEDKELFLFHHGLLAPVPETGSGDDPAYEYLKEMEKIKTRHEAARQLYVAATRARKKLHLLGYVKENGKPWHNSQLAVIWKGLSEEEQRIFVQAAVTVPEAAANGAGEAAVRQRLADGPLSAPRVTPIGWARSEDILPAPPQPSFEWVSDASRHAGTALHALLQRGLERAGKGVIRHALAQLGVPRAAMEKTVRRVEEALRTMLASERGQWILNPRESTRCELAVTGVVDGKILRGTVDRTFVDEEGTRWVIDFKTSEHQGGEVGQFLEEEERRYRPQLERYGKVLAGMGQPVRLALYFPLLDEWREVTQANR